MPEHDALQGRGEAPRGGHAADVRRGSSRSRAALPLDVVSAGLAVHRVSVPPEDVVFVKGLIEASEGLAGVFAEQGGELLLAAPHEREAELCELLADLEEELRARSAPAPRAPAGSQASPGSGRRTCEASP